MPDERHPDDVDADFALEEQEQEQQQEQERARAETERAADPKGSEVRADQRRAGGGPRYHGESWELAEHEGEHESIERHLSGDPDEQPGDDEPPPRTGRRPG